MSQSFPYTVPAFSCYLLPLKSKHSNVQPVLKHLPPQYMPTFVINTVDHNPISLSLSQHLPVEFSLEQMVVTVCV
jgi:hypothetical protein